MSITRRTISSAALAGAILAGALFCACSNKTEETTPSVTDASTITEESLLESDASALVSVTNTPTIAVTTATLTPTPTVSGLDLVGDNKTYTGSKDISELVFCDANGVEMDGDYDISTNGMSVVITFKDDVNAEDYTCDAYLQGAIDKENLSVIQGSSPFVISITYDSELAGGDYALVLRNTASDKTVCIAYATVYTNEQGEE